MSNQTPTEEALEMERAAGKKEGVDQCRSILIGEIRRLRVLQGKEYEGGRQRAIRSLTTMERRFPKAKP